MALPFRRRAIRPARSLALVVALLGAGLVVSCADQSGDITPDLSGVPSGPVWPSPPDRARYALAGVLVGEESFIDRSRLASGGFRRAFEVIAGIVTGPRSPKELRRPTAGLVREDGSILVVDAGHKGVVVFDFPEKRFKVWDEARRGVTFETPVAIAADGQGGYLVTDADYGRVFRLDASGKPAGEFGGGVLGRPTGIARDPSTGAIFVADTARHDIKVFDASGSLTGTIAGPGRSVGRLNTPTHLSFDGDRLYVADTLNFRVQAFNRDGTPVLDFGELGLEVGNLSRPKGVAVGGGGRIYVVESYYDHLLVFDPEGELLLPIGGTGQGIGQFYLPSGVWTDDENRVYVADMFNGRVMVFSELTGLEGER